MSIPRTALCEFEGCHNESADVVAGIDVCERCARDFESVGWGAVYFNNHYHGVRGAFYTEEQARACPGLPIRGRHSS